MEMHPKIMLWQLGCLVVANCDYLDSLSQLEGLLEFGEIVCGSPSRW